MSVLVPRSASSDAATTVLPNAVCGREHARVVREQRVGGGRLLRRELPEECCRDRTARVTLVAQVKADAELFEQSLHRRQAAARQRDVVR